MTAARRQTSPRVVLPAAVVSAVASVLFFLALETQVLGDGATVALDDYVSSVGPLLSAGLAARAARTAQGRERRGWALISLGLVSWGAGSAVWAVYEVHLGQAVPFPSLADVGYLLWVPLSAAGVVHLGPGLLGRVGRLRPLVDGGIAASALLFVSWATVLGPTYSESEGSLLARVIAVAYPVGDVITATAALLVMGQARGRVKGTVALVSGGLFCVACADSLFNWFTAHSAYTTGNLLDGLWFTGFLTIGVGALYAQAGRLATEATNEPITEPITEPTAEPTAAEFVSPGRLAMSLPYLPLGLSIPFAVVRQLDGQPLEALLFWDMLASIVLVLARQLLSLQANVVLTKTLHETVNTLQRREAELHHHAFHDPLTGLANRALLAERVDQALLRARRGGTVAVLFVDLDDFKGINDTLGHAAGDELIRCVAERLTATVRPGDTVARLGGDEFAVLIEGAFADARVVAERIQQALEPPVRLEGGDRQARASIGVAVTNGEGSQEALLRDADIAMYAAKAQGKGRYVMFAEEIGDSARDHHRLRADLPGALARGEFFLQYQPLVDITTGAVTGAEALLRWRRNGVLVAPHAFIPLAEETGDIRPIGRWVIHEACAAAGRWQLARSPGTPPLRLNVNLSARQLSDPELMSTLSTSLVEAHLAARLLTLEITESMLLDDEPETLQVIAGLREAGIRLAIDDFGTGYSSLGMLRRFPVDILKVDRSFLADDGTENLGAGSDVLLGSVVSLGRGLGLDVVAEGVETEQQLAALRRVGCVQAQGFLFARPTDEATIADLVRRGVRLVDAADPAPPARTAGAAPGARS